MPDPASVVPRDRALPRVLVIDDELGMREGMRRILTRHGYPVCTAEDGAAALALAAREDFSLVLVDLKMPGIDGLEVMARLRESRPGAVCVVVSAFATIESAVQSTKMGAFDFVVKPFVPDELMRVVTRAAEQWQLAVDTARLRAEREAHLLELSAEKSRLRTILQSMGEGLLVVNIDGEVVLDNPVSRRFLGRVQAEALARVPVGELIADQRFLAAVARLRDRNAPDGAVVLEVRQGEADLRATLAPVRDAGGAVLGVVVLLADITDAKALERMKTFFVTMVAHEVKAPLSAVEGYLNLMLSGELDTDAAQRHGIVRRCLQRTGALLALVQDLLELTRRQTGHAEKRVALVDLEQLVTELVQFHAPEAATRGIGLALSAVGEVPRPLADRDDLERVATNLLSNAIKYNRDGGRVTVRLRGAQAAVVLEVVDTGIGMSEDERARLGQEFFRAKNVATRHITGTGLGIALVRKILASYNGTLEVESTPGQGSTFRVVLPAPRDERSHAPA